MKCLSLLAALGAGLLPSVADAQPCINFSQTTETLQVCGPYVNPVDPTPSQDYTLKFAVPRGLADRGRVYYTADGTDPRGARGEPLGTTRVVEVTSTCVFGKAIYDVFTATIPAQPVGTTVRFVLSVRTASGATVHVEELERFLGSGDAACACTGDTCARVFVYTVLDPGPPPADGAKSSPGCSAAPGALGFAGPAVALAAMLRRRRRAKVAPADVKSTDLEEGSDETV